MNSNGFCNVRIIKYQRKFNSIFSSKESVLNNLPIYLTPRPPLYEWRGGEWVSYFVFIPKDYYRIICAQVLIFTIMLVFLIRPISVSALDHMADFVSENYKELKTGDADGPKIYHTIQVDTTEGSKVLMLTGKDLEYRKWLRQYLSRYHKLIVTVPDQEAGLFSASKLFKIDVNNIHPVSGTPWIAPPVTASPPIVPLPFEGEKHILIVDDNPQKRSLIEMVVKDLDLPVTLAANAYDGLTIFRQQPDKFQLIIADSDIAGELSTTSLVRHIIETDPQMPVIVGTDYNEPKMTAMFMDFFSGFSHVTVKPLVLEELSKTILQLLEKNV